MRRTVLRVPPPRSSSSGGLQKPKLTASLRSALTSSLPEGRGETLLFLNSVLHHLAPPAEICNAASIKRKRPAVVASKKANKSSLLEEDLLCCVCCDIFRDPVVLLCSHSVCKTCLQKFWKSKGSRECPVCRRKCLKSKPPRNLVLKNLCESFLESRSLGSSEGSEVLCSLHNEELKLFCLDDQQPLCLVCHLSNAHKNHSCCPAEEAVHDLKNKLQSALKPLQKSLKVLEETKQDYEQISAHIKTQAQHTERKINKDFEKLHQFLRDEKAARIAALKEEEEQKSQMMTTKIMEMSGEISSLLETIRNIEKEIKAEDVPFLQNYKSTEKTVHHKPKHPEKTSGAQIDVAKHISNLKFRVWEKMQGILQYTPVTLDPNSAHPHLHLSDDLDTLEHSQQRSSLPDNPERFDTFTCVLGSEGFTSGIHCWDVQVGENENWELGVIRGSVPRKGFSFLSTTFSLCYHYSTDIYVIHCPGQPDHSITLKEKLRRVRVQLDWNRGEVTFTDLVTNTRLHTITHTFTQRVFPFFSNKSLLWPMRIVPMKASVQLEQRN